MPLYPGVGGSGHSNRSEAQGRMPQYIRGLASIPEDQEFSGPYTERDSESSDDDVAPRRRRAGKEPMTDTEQRSRSTQGMNPQNPVNKAIKCRAFHQTLSGMAQWWYSRLPPNSIGSFKDLSQAFIKQFISGRVHEKSSASLIGIVQGAKESLREYLNRFTKEALKVPNLDDKVAMIALQQGTRDGLFKMSLAKHPPESMMQLQDRAGKYIKVEESMKKTAVNNEPIGNKKRKTDQEYDAKDKKLKDEIEYLIRRGNFRRFTKGEEAGGQKGDNDRRDDDRRGNDRDRNPQPRGPVINIISRGPTALGNTRNSRKAYAREVMSIVGEPSKRSKSEMALEFGDPDLEGLKFPLVITLIIGNCPVMRLLVDNRASVDIPFHDTFIRMGYNDSHLTPSDAPIYGFNHVECKVE
ncbi:uncharacterized protein LOC141673649 [Apium graveolens]|uniref:uncharacterized protein LOC141673649 n=1 Tax=Apium graveolens TaxID=4045 RepID=UPI003D7B4ECE